MKYGQWEKNARVVKNVCRWIRSTLAIAMTYMLHGTCYMLHGTCYMAHGTWHMVRGSVGGRADQNGSESEAFGVEWSAGGEVRYSE